MNLAVKKTLTKQTFKIKCLCAAFFVIAVVAAALAVNVMFADAAVSAIWLDTPAKGKVVDVNTNLQIPLLRVIRVRIPEQF